MNINGVKKIKVKKMYSDKHMSDIRGNFIDRVSTIINYDCDVYDEKGEIILKFRKNIIPEKLCKIGYDSYSISYRIYVTIVKEPDPIQTTNIK